MFIAMNRFKIAPGREAEFEAIWRNRKSRLAELEGYVSFDLLRGSQKDDHVLYASHTLWRTRAHFEAWTKSEQFRASHGGAGASKGIILAHPEFEGFEAVLSETNERIAAE